MSISSEPVLSLWDPGCGELTSGALARHSDMLQRGTSQTGEKQPVCAPAQGTGGKGCPLAAICQP